jgi:hypothetical protein
MRLGFVMAAASLGGMFLGTTREALYAFATMLALMALLLLFSVASKVGVRRGPSLGCPLVRGHEALVHGG